MDNQDPSNQTNINVSLKLPRNFGRIALIIFGVLLLSGVGFLGYNWYQGRDSYQLPDNKVKSLNYDIFVPQRLHGYTVEPKSISFSGLSTTYVVRNKKTNNTVSVIQIKKDTVDYQSLINRLKNTHTFPTAYGDAVVGHFADPTQNGASLVADKTWVALVGEIGGASEKDMEAVLKSLRLQEKIKA